MKVTVVALSMKAVEVVLWVTRACSCRSLWGGRMSVSNIVGLTYVLRLLHM